jgi:hypothetical protein
MSTIPTLALIPSGVKASKVYSVLPTDGTGDFTFSRAGALPSFNATRVNSDGLIEEVLSNVPRLNYPMIDGVVSGCPSLLLEPQRSNLILRSEEFDNASWTKNNSSISANSVVSPDGSTNADSLIENTANASHNIFQSVNVTIGTTYTISFFVKANGRTRFRIADNFGRLPLNVIFDLSTVTVVSGTGSISDYGNGWYRCTVSSTATATASEFIYIIMVSSGTTTTYTGDGVSGLYLWGAQLEAGSYSSSYIPTVASTVTRVAETASKTGLSSLIGQSEGTFFIELSSLSNSVVNEQISISDGTDANTVKFVFGSAVSGIRTEGRITSISQFAITKLTSDYNTNKKIAFSYKQNDFKFYYNGELVGVDISGNIPANLSVIRFSTGASTNPFYGKVKNLQVYPTALSDVELIALTTL